ncbi:hypothetical protein AMTRI_Chr04g251580 [Amborella trichopoda]
MAFPAMKAFVNSFSVYFSLFLFLCFSAMADSEPKETEALFALKDTFNNSFLNEHWNGLPCFENTSHWYGISCINGTVTGVVVENFRLSGVIKPDALFNLTNLEVISFMNNSISGNIMDFSYNPKLVSTDLSYNKFSGKIPPSLLSLNHLLNLQLESNNLSGTVPEFQQKSLRSFNVSYNNLEGPIPPFLQSIDPSSYQGNPKLCGFPTRQICIIDPTGVPANSPENQPEDSPQSKKKKKGFFKQSLVVAIFVLFDVIVLVLVSYLFFVYFKKTKSNKKSKEKNQETVTQERGREEERGELSFMEEGGGFSLEELLRASAEGLGKGSFGSCYKAMLEGGPCVVVKRMKDLNNFSREEFGNQVRGLAQLKHPNLLPILGYYYSKEEKLLLLPYAPHGNLYDRIHGYRDSIGRIRFKWRSRLSVAQGVARAMAFLHSDSNALPHGNLKSTNVLLSANDRPLVADYSLSPFLALPSAVHRMVAYKSPEYLHRRKISPKSDVWSFGYLLLELLTGKISAHSALPGTTGVDLPVWVNRAVREEWTAEIFDQEILGAAEGLVQMLRVAMSCCERSPEKRPEMEAVLAEVEEIVALEATDGAEEGESAGSSEVSFVGTSESSASWRRASVSEERDDE